MVGVEVSSVRQFWKRRKARLQARFTYIDAKSRERPWLVALSEDGMEPLRVGGVECLRLFGAEAAAQSGTMAAFPAASLETLRIPKLLRHEQYTIHKKALESIAAQVKGETAHVWAPNLDQFRAEHAREPRTNYHVQTKVKDHSCYCKQE